MRGGDEANVPPVNGEKRFLYNGATFVFSEWIFRLVNLLLQKDHNIYGARFVAQIITQVFRKTLDGS